jgi:uncharacterized membrane protein YcaP (DUF421 family)
MDELFYLGWAGPVRALVLGVLTYGILLTLIRVSGKRTLAKMNAFDLVITVALGSTLATIILNNDVALVDGAAALSVLVGLQFVISWLSVRYSWLEPLVKNQPALLVDHGRLVKRNMLRERVSEADIRSAARSFGFSDLTHDMSMVLETDGSFSVVFRRSPSAVQHVNQGRHP